MQSVSINVHLQSAVTHTASRSKVAMTEGSAYIYLHAENETGKTKKQDVNITAFMKYLHKPT